MIGRGGERSVGGIGESREWRMEGVLKEKNQQ